MITTHRGPTPRSTRWRGRCWAGPRVWPPNSSARWPCPRWLRRAVPRRAGERTIDEQEPHRGRSGRLELRAARGSLGCHPGTEPWPTSATGACLRDPARLPARDRRSGRGPPRLPGARLAQAAGGPGRGGRGRARPATGAGPGARRGRARPGQRVALSDDGCAGHHRTGRVPRPGPRLHQPAAAAPCPVAVVRSERE